MRRTHVTGTHTRCWCVRTVLQLVSARNLLALAAAIDAGTEVDNVADFSTADEAASVIEVAVASGSEYEVHSPGL